MAVATMVASMATMKVASMMETMTNGRLERSTVLDMAFLSELLHPGSKHANAAITAMVERLVCGIKALGRDDWRANAG
ncbi:hypothetical protein thsrh120_35640 [Rhizobium sp. No.120]